MRSVDLLFDWIWSQKSRLVIWSAVFVVTTMFAIPFFAKGTRHGPSVISNIHILQIGLDIYRQDEGVFPEMHTPEELQKSLYPIIVHDLKCFSDPDSRQPIIPNRNLSGRIGGPPNLKPDVAISLYCPRVDIPGRYCVGFLTGTVKMLDTREWQEVKSANRL